MEESSQAPSRFSPLAVGRACILLAALLWSSNGFFAKNTIFAEWPSETRGLVLAFWRALFAAIVILPAVRRPRWNVRLVPMALSFALMNVTFLQSMVLTTAANAIWLQNTSPFWLLLLNALIWREPIDRRNFVPLAFALVGVGLILVFELHAKTFVEAQGVLLGIVSGICFAVVIAMMRNLRGEDSAWLVSVNLLTTSVVLAPYVLMYGPRPSVAQLGVLLGFGAFQMGLPYLLFARGLRSVSSDEGVILALLEPCFVPLWTYLAWGERVAWWTLAGAAFILVGLVLRYGLMYRNWPRGAVPIKEQADTEPYTPPPAEPSSPTVETPPAPTVVAQSKQKLSGPSLP